MIYIWIAEGCVFAERDGETRSAAKEKDVRSLMIGLVLLTILPLTSSLQASVIHHDLDYRPAASSAWTYHSSYRDVASARGMAQSLRRVGFQARVISRSSRGNRVSTQ